jgi:membrane protein DedA with SNARE-associated domain
MIDFLSLDILYLVYFFILVFLASFAIPTGSLIVIVSFASSARGWVDVSVLLFLALIATISGDYMAFCILRFFRDKINPMIKNTIWTRNKFTSVEKLFAKYSYYTIFLTRFLFSGIGPFVNFFSGLQAMPKMKFLRPVILGEILYCVIYISIGYFFRDTWQEILIFAQDYITLIIFTALGLYFAYKIVKLIWEHK